jgi:hypothetical protein
MSVPVRFSSASLLGTLLLLILVYPSIPDGVWVQRFLSLTTLGVIIGGLWEFQNERRWFLPAVVLAIPTALISLLHAGSESSPILLPIFQIPLYALVTANLVVHTLKPGRISLEKLSAAVSGYLMLALTWAAVYELTELLSPGSFMAANDRSLSNFDHLYFSIVTLTTLGYGDIAPVTDRARSFVMLEAVGGTLYLVVLISRLVSTFGQVHGTPIASGRSTGRAPKRHDL